MAGNFIKKSRHGTVYHFRRRVPAIAQHAIGHPVILLSLQTSDRRLAIMRGRALAAHTDTLFQRIIMAKKSGKSDGIKIDYSFHINVNTDGTPSSYSFQDVEAEDQEAINSHIRTLTEARTNQVAPSAPTKPQKPFAEAISEFYTQSQLKGLHYEHSVRASIWRKNFLAKAATCYRLIKAGLPNFATM